MSKNLKGLKNKENQDNEESNGLEKEPISERLKHLRNKLKLGPHHRIERFIISVSILFFFLTVFTVSAFTVNRSHLSTIESTQSVFTNEFEFSLSGVTGGVDRIYRSEDGTDVMMLFKFVDLENMSSNAENYELFITAEDGGELDQEPEMTFSLFGSTGYGIIRFQDSVAIEPEIMDITIRANENLTDIEGSSGNDEDGDGSFDDYDQTTIYANPGADDITVIDILGRDEINPADLYTELVGIHLDEMIHVQIYEKINELNTLLTRSDEYINRLTKSGYIPPEDPWFIKGDYIEDNTPDDIDTELDDVDMGEQEIGQESVEYKEKVPLIDTLVYKPSKDLKFSFGFEYHEKTIRDGYLNQVINDMSEYEDYIKKHRESYTDEDDDGEFDESILRVEVLIHEDGSKLVLDEVQSGESPSAQVAAKDAVGTLESIWSEYLGVKGELQRDILRELVVLDADVQSQPSGYSENNDQEKFFFY